MESWEFYLINQNTIKLSFFYFIKISQYKNGSKKNMF
jgi:hypothetical protein